MMQLEEKQNSNQNINQNMNQDNQISEAYLNQLAQVYGTRHSDEVDRIVPWKKYLNYLALGILMSLITVTNRELLNSITQTIGMVLLVYSLGVMQEGNRFIAYSYRVSLGFMLYHLFLGIIHVENRLVYMIFVITIMFYVVILLLFIKGMAQIVENPQRKESIVKSLDGIMWSALYILNMFIFGTITGRGGYTWNENAVGIFWLVGIIIAIVCWCQNFERLSRKLALDGYGIQVVSTRKKQYIQMLVWGWAILNIVLGFVEFW